ncbi:hypothetical protein K439DRAFT_492531 [Ramaria rubella]|nr:hypothetical protein K439DRAFT_492531 [Ramaria rubella]
MEEIALSTFDVYDMQVVVSVLTERLSACTEQLSYRHLIKALAVINHCLRYGSPLFADWFKERPDLILPLCTVPALVSINVAATAVLNHLNCVVQEDETSSVLQARADINFESRSSSVADSDSIELQEPVKDLTAFITASGQHPIAHGGYSLVYKATLCVGSWTEIVAKKVLSPHQIPRERLRKVR